MLMLNVSRHMRRCLVLIIAPLLLLAGCAKFDTAMEIKDENHVHLKSTVGVSKSIASTSAGSLASEFSDCNNSKGSAGTGSDGTVEKFEDNSYIGCIIAGETTAADLNKEDGMQITFDKNKVSFKMTSDLFRDSGRSDRTPDASMFSDFKVSVTFPGKVLSHSGSSKVDGNTVTWTDPSDLFSSSGLTVTSKRSNGIPIWVWVIVAVAVLAIVGVVVVILNKKKGQKAGQPENGGAPWTMQYPGDGQPQGQLQQWNGQLYQGDPYAQPPYQDPSYQDPRQQEPGQLWGNQPLGHVSGGATSASQTGQNPIPNQGSQPGQQPPSDPDDFWKNHGSY